MPEPLTDRQLRFVQKPRIARLGTTRADGAPHVSPVWYRFEDGEFRILVDRGSEKHKNVEHDSRVVLCIDDAMPPYHTVLVRGRAKVVDAPGPEWRLALAVHYLGEENGRRYTETTDASNGIMLRITPGKVTGW